MGVAAAAPVAHGMGRLDTVAAVQATVIATMGTTTLHPLPWNPRMKLLSGAEAAAVPVRPAATTLVLRDGFAGMEVLMVRRSPHASFMPGAYVFPGGAVDDGDAAAPADETGAQLAQRIGGPTALAERAAAFAVAGLRECFEECGLWLGAHTVSAGELATLRRRLHAGEKLAALAQEAALPLATSALVPWARWVTPLGVPKRFDTLFVVCAAPPAQEATPDETETTTLAWVLPGAALMEHAVGRFQMEFATQRTVASLVGFSAGTVADCLKHAAGLAHIPITQPRIARDAQGQPVGPVLPGQPGYEQAQG